MAARRGEQRVEPERDGMTERARQSPAKRGFSIALLLFLFGASLVVPALAFTAVLLDRNWQAQEAKTRRRLEQLVGDLAHDVDRELTLLLAHLAALAASPDVAAGDWAAVHTKARASLKPLGIEVLFRDADGQQVMNTRVAWGTPPPRTEQPAIDPAVRANLKPHVSDMVAGRIAGRQVITLTVPVMGGEERLAGFLHMSLDPERFLTTMEGQNLRPSGIPASATAPARSSRGCAATATSWADSFLTICARRACSAPAPSAPSTSKACRPCAPPRSRR